MAVSSRSLKSSRLGSPGFVDQNQEKVSRSLAKLNHNHGSADEGLAGALPAAENNPMMSFHERVTNSAHNKLIAKERSDNIHVIGTGVKIQVHENIYFGMIIE